MNRLIALLLVALAASPVLSRADSSVSDLPEAPAAFPPAYATVLRKYVSARGVDYAAWHADAADLRALADVVQFYATTSPPVGKSASDKAPALAWHLNAYNSWILHLLLKKYPTEGPLAGDSKFFHADQIVVAGEKLSLDALEQKLIRPVFKEPRVHFALNCASVSCPPLQPRPFEPATLDADLARLTAEFIDGPGVTYVAATKTMTISQIFDWYAEDFGGKSRLIAYLNRYRDRPIPTDATIVFAPYSWELNAR